MSAGTLDEQVLNIDGSKPINNVWSMRFAASADNPIYVAYGIVVTMDDGNTKQEIYSYIKSTILGGPHLVRWGAHILKDNKYSSENTSKEKPSNSSVTFSRIRTGLYHTTIFIAPINNVK